MPKGVYVRTEKMKKNIGKYIRTEEIKKKNSKSMKGKIPWNNNVPCSKETKKKISKSNKIILNKLEIKEKLKGKKSKEHCNNISKAKKGKPTWNKGKKMSKEYIENMKICSFEGYHHTEKAKKEISDKLKGRERSKEHSGNISKALKGKYVGNKNPNWNPNRVEVYAPYDENFYDEKLRNEKWKLQNGRDMLTGTILDFVKKPAYHHIDYNKSNDDSDNICFVSNSNHMRITGYQRNPIKSERYKKILQENTLALKNGKIPKYWNQINKELFRLEKLKQLDLSSYII